MQLLRDNLTLWTSSDGSEPEPAADAVKVEDKPAETAPEEASADATEESKA